MPHVATGFFAGTASALNPTRARGSLTDVQTDGADVTVWVVVKVARLVGMLIEAVEGTATRAALVFEVAALQDVWKSTLGQYWVFFVIWW